MTSAARPTWFPSLANKGDGTRDGSSGLFTMQISARDLVSHTILKVRHDLLGVNQPDQVDTKEKRRRLFLKEMQTRLGTNRVEEPLLSSKLLEIETPLNPDADLPVNIFDNAVAEEDEEEALLKELERIKQERNAAKTKHEAAKLDATLRGNPLISNLGNDATNCITDKIISKWDDDVVFKNQAKGHNDRPQKRFINDTIRSDFHRRFLDRYIK